MELPTGSPRGIHACSAGQQKTNVIEANPTSLNGLKAHPKPLNDAHSYPIHDLNHEVPAQHVLVKFVNHHPLLP